MSGLIWTIIYIVGLLCCIWCVIDVWKHNIGIIGKILLTICLLAFSWVGLIVYYLFIRGMLK